MKKNELRTGMVVELRNNKKYMVIMNALVRHNEYLELNCYEDDLTVKNDDWGLLIVKIYEANKTYQLTEENWGDMPCIWEREPEVDWNMIPVDTKVLVKGCTSDDWMPGHFATYKNGKVYTWTNGTTSWTSIDGNTNVWKYAILYKEMENK